MSDSGLPSLTVELRDELRAVYRSADEVVAGAGPVCEASGKCCRFTEYGHTLFLSDLEAALLLESAPPYNSVTRHVCPFQVDGLCTARTDRPLGCRVYFCDPSYQDVMPEILESHLRQIKEIADRHGRAWRYAPLHAFLGEALTAGRPKRVPLPLAATR
jgi:Fe-S-cluster containining protein